MTHRCRYHCERHFFLLISFFVFPFTISSTFIWMIFIRTFHIAAFIRLLNSSFHYTFAFFIGFPICRAFLSQNSEIISSHHTMVLNCIALYTYMSASMISLFSWSYILAIDIALISIKLLAGGWCRSWCKSIGANLMGIGRCVCFERVPNKDLSVSSSVW